MIKDFHRNPAPQSRKLIEHVQPSHMAVDLEGVEGIVIQNQALEVCIIAQARKNLNLTKHQLIMQGNVALQNVSVSVGQGQVALRPDKSTAMAAQLRQLSGFRFQFCQEPFGSSLASGNMGMQGCCSKIENPKVFQIRLALRTQRPTTLDIPEKLPSPQGVDIWTRPRPSSPDNKNWLSKFFGKASKCFAKISLAQGQKVHKSSAGFLDEMI